MNYANSPSARVINPSCYETTLALHIIPITMSREKEGKQKSDKTAPAKNLMEKRAAKAAKKEAKRNEHTL